MSSKLRILLIQAREAGDPMLDHELGAFAARTQLPREAFTSFNAADDDVDDFDTAGFDALMVGGSGDFSLVDGGFDWHEDFLYLTRQVLNARIPLFASCFGFQSIVQALGGTLARDEDRAEIGTFQITLTDAAQEDPLFGELPRQFDAQLGHNDSAVHLPEALVHLASSECCEYQAIRVKDRPVVATQFHPELTLNDNLERFECYLKNYKRPGQDFEQAMAYARQIHRPSPHSCGLLHSFVADLHRRAERIPTVDAAE